jgi:hypothetical protein
MFGMGRKMGLMAGIRSIRSNARYSGKKIDIP